VVRKLPANVGSGGDVTTLYNNLLCDDEKFRQTLRSLPALTPEEINSEYCEVIENPNGGGEWATPISFGEYCLPKFPTHTLPPWLSSYISELATATQTPVDLAAMLGLGALAACFQGIAEVEVDPGYREPLSLFVVVALPPGNRKSAVFRQVLTPIYDFEDQLAEELGHQLAELRTRRSILEKRHAAAENTAARANDRKERERAEREAITLANELTQLPEAVTPRLVVDDITPERLAAMLAEQGGRIAMFSTEGGIFAIMAGRYSQSKEPNFEIFLKGHAGDPLAVDRVAGRQDRIASPALSVALTVQPAVLRGLAFGRQRQFRDRGLLARFLYSLPVSLLGRRTSSPPQVALTVSDAYHQQMSNLLHIAREQGDADEPSVLHLTEDARKVLLAFEQWIEPQLGPSGDLRPIVDWAAKLAGAVARIAGLLSLAKDLGDDGDLSEWRVDAETVHDAVSIGHYLIAHAKAAFYEMGSNPAVEDARRILAWIERKDLSRFTKRDVHQAHRSHFKTVSDLDPALRLLEEHGYIRLHEAPPQSSPGRPRSPVYDVNPRLGEASQKTHNTHNPVVSPSSEHITEARASPNLDSGIPAAGASAGTGEPLPGALPAPGAADDKAQKNEEELAERVGIKEDSGVPRPEAERQAVREHQAMTGRRPSAGSRPRWRRRATAEEQS
jgi:hypothetical protein